MKSEEEEQLTQYAQNDFLPINLTSLVIADWSNSKLQEIVRGAEVFKAMCWKGTATFKEGHTYTGAMRNGKMHGEGKFVWKDGTVYEGKFKKNEITGTGTYTWPDGTSYKGEVKDGIRNGRGVFINPKDGYKYDGEWKDGLRHGKGTLSYEVEGAEKDTFVGYEGEWKEGEKCGYGKYVYPSGNWYEGEWINNKRNGKGTMHWQKIGNKLTNEKYTGQWKDDMQSGFGTHIWLDEKSENKVLRNRYVGYWKNGAREGHGIFFYANGSMYIGYWKNNMKDGWGKFVYEDGSEFEGMYSKDRLIDKTGSKTLTAGIQAVPDVNAAQALHKEIEKIAKTAPKQDKKTEKGAAKEVPKQQPGPKARPEVDSNPYSRMIDCSDLIAFEQLLVPEKVSTSPIKGSPNRSPSAAGGGQYIGKPKEVQEELNNILLTHHSELKHWYKYFCGIDKLEFEEGFMLVARQFWRMLNVCKVNNAAFTLAQFNRIYLRGKKTFFSLKYNPFYGSEGKKEEWRPTTTESGASKKEVNKTGTANIPVDPIKVETRNPDTMEKVESAINPVKPMEVDNSRISNILEDGPINPIAGRMDNSDDELPIEEIEPFEKEDMHDPLRPMLFRHFAEAIIRAAYLYYLNEPGSVKTKLNSFFNDKLKPNLPELAKRGKKKEFEAPKPSLVYLFDDQFKPFEKDLLAIFRLYSRQAKHKMAQFADYTLLVKDFINMVQIGFGQESLKTEDIIAIIESGFDPAQTYAGIKAQKIEGMTEAQKNNLLEDHLQAIMIYEMTYYEYKAALLELVKKIKKTEDLKEEHIREIMILWVSKLRKKEVKIIAAPKRIWRQSEKEVKYQIRLEEKRKQKEEELKKAEELRKQKYICLINK